jgi:pimeloyl-ACP methyl ester carboxylesterase
MSRRRSDRVEWRRGRGAERDAVLHVRVFGTGRPTIVLLHGLTASNRSWGAAFDSLADDCAVVVPDLMGFGASPRPGFGYGPDAHADAVAGCLDALGLYGPVIVAGHSMGALIALRLATRRPKLVAAVVAIAPPIYRDSTDARRRIAGLGPVARMFALDTPWARRLCALMCRYRPVAARLAAWFRADLPAELARASMQHTWASYSHSLNEVILAAGARADVAASSVPVRILAGDADNVIDLPFLQRLADELPHVALERVPGGGHDIHLTDPSRCITAIRASIATAAPPESSSQ